MDVPLFSLTPFVDRDSGDRILAGYKILSSAKNVSIYGFWLDMRFHIGPKLRTPKKHLTMVTTFGVTDNAYAKELVANSLILEDLF